MATIKITFASTITAAARERVTARMDRLLLVDPDLNGAEIEYASGEALEVDCKNETLAAQLYRAACDAIDGDVS